MPRSAIDVIAPAFEHMKTQLFRPFRRGHWARLALLGLATGELSSGGGCHTNWSIPGPSSSHPASDHFASALAGFPHPVLAPLAIAALITLGLALAIVLTYVGSVCRFMLFETVLTRQCALREQWRRWQEQGLRFFGFNLLMLAVMVAGLAVLVGLPALFLYRTGILRNPSGHVALLVVGGALLATLILAFFVAAAVVVVLTKDFVVPQMALENVGIADGWRRLLPRMEAERRSYLGYIGMKIVLALAAAVALGIATLVLVLALVIPAAVVAVIVVVIWKPVGLAWTAATISLAVTGGLVLLAALIYAMGFIGSPVTVFFPAYSMYFFADRYPPLAARLYPPPPAPRPPTPELAPAT